ncbi:hypothetical protein FRC03_001638 [Tulasnella sp. 419]|nr:hypothetical protein FRC02_001717 [Tulasnella sp. 418]KAG8945755.1 hypothetical protein FRC03_001638 [Tulasnella sp. 419]
MASDEKKSISGGSNELEIAADLDEQQLEHLGYKQQLFRSFGVIESFASGFASINFIGGVRGMFFIGLLAGGPLAIWTTHLASIIFMSITCATIAELCSALPVSGSIYIWAAQAAGPKYGRFVGFIVAWWAAAAWTTFAATVAQTVAFYILSLVIVYELDFPGGVSNANVKWRTVVWIVSEGFLLVAIGVNFLSARWYKWILRGSIWLICLDFLLCVIWLPIGASKTYGLRTGHEAFLTRYNETGAPEGWNWILSFLFTCTLFVGFEAAGHVAEETKDASIVAARSMLRNVLASAIGGFVTTLVFLFCTPDIETLFSLQAPQPFVLIYSMALGRGGGTFMTVLATITCLLTCCVVILTGSRIIFAIARDGALPFSSWVGRVSSDGRPQNSVIVLSGSAALLLCTIIPSTVAFTSLVSVASVSLIASYGLTGLLRLVMTRNSFKNTQFSLGRASKLFYASTALFCALIFAVYVSPFVFPVTAQNLNFGGIIFGAVTILGLISYWLTPEDRWLSHEQVRQMYNGANEPVQTTDPPSGHKSNS